MITNAEKAVLFLLSLDEQAAANVVRELGEAELRKLRAVASTMREVPAGALDDTFRDFLQRSAGAMAVPRGGLPYLRRLSAGALGEQRAREIFEDGVTSPLARLEGAPSDAVAALLEKEPPSSWRRSSPGWSRATPPRSSTRCLPSANAPSSDMSAP